MLYCEVEKTYDLFFKQHFKLKILDQDIYRVSPQKIQVFGGKKMLLEISIPVEYSTKNWFFHLWEKAEKWHLTSKSAIFQRILTLYTQYLGLVRKLFIDTFSNL